MGAYHVESPARVEVINRMVAEDPPAPLLSDRKSVV